MSNSPDWLLNIINVAHQWNSQTPNQFGMKGPEEIGVETNSLTIGQ